MISNEQETNPMEYVIGIDIGGTNSRIGAIDRHGKIISYHIERSQSVFKNTDVIASLSRFIAVFIEELHRDGLRGICLGFPGTISKDKSFVLSCPNLLSFNGKDVGRPLSELFHVPVVVEHDVILLLAYDMYIFDLYRHDCIMAVYVGTGLGNSMYIHGRFLVGKNGVSGELGHIPVLGSRDICPCGNAGCIELYSAGKCLENIWSQYFSDTEMFSKIFTLHRSDSIIQTYIDSMAVAISTEINILDPDCILISGGVLSMPDFPYETLLEHIHMHTRKPYPEQNLTFIRGIQDKCAGIKGAGIYMWDRLQQV